ncbi:hypothetical protein NLJ89_g2590 [Agrocybe chaxingu]|uniref:Glycoside hydrolase family 88 protein n=1 Tax=Agrocybe chaxingu TaxID=84603 RepID=A0A9W8KAY9_9AGAR|nr:hypothetical protein NLJ89_g2590 [Agrocybe chaxingu]
MPRLSSLLFGGIACALLVAEGVMAQTRSYAAWAAESAMRRGQGKGLDASGNSLVNYEHGELQWALRLLYERTGNQTYYDYILSGASNVVADDGTVGGRYSLSDYSLDPLRTGPTFLYLYQQTKDQKWKTAADTFKKQLETHPRTAQGQFWHKKIYPYQGWLDGVYMGDVFYAQYVKDFQSTNVSAWGDIVNQIANMALMSIQVPGVQNYNGLLYHGYDYSKKAVWAAPDRGHSPEVWNRALGWYTMALVDVLDILPDGSGRLQVLNIIQTLAPRIRDAADKATGVWWLVMTQPGREGNYFESSGSAMFVYSLLKAVRKGYVADYDGSIVRAATKAYNYMTANWVIPNPDGTMGWTNTVMVGSLSGTGDYQVFAQPSTPTKRANLAAITSK